MNGRADARRDTSHETAWGTSAMGKMTLDTSDHKTQPVVSSKHKLTRRFFVEKQSTNDIIKYAQQKDLSVQTYVMRSRDRYSKPVILWANPSNNVP
ncbi:hypothetical protein MAR_003590 [Mya arenaria]|uniref:Uncharacterized protein n=1 Tax=Mya arenaria TaxID=6604 RepID=A0ABY7G6F2_MYAAR|nr:hypothetical protein MAR_003590 [Mya arenaria]